MMDSQEALLAVVYRFYPRGVSKTDPLYEGTEEYLRLAAARRQAGADKVRWHALLKRIGDQFSGPMLDGSCHLPTGRHDAGYSGHLFLPNAGGEHSHSIGFVVSFLVPRYIVYATSVTDDPDATEARRERHRHTVVLGIDGVCWALPRSVVAPEVLAQVDRELDESEPARRREVRFALSPEERSCAATIAQEIEATWGYKPMPPETGKVIVLDVATNHREIGEATLHDCLFSDNL